VQQQTRDGGWQGAEQHRPGEASVRREALAAQAESEIARQRPQVLAEIPQHRGERADVHGAIEGQALVRPAQQFRYQDQVRRTRNRQEFSDALHDGEHDHLQQTRFGCRHGNGVDGAKKAPPPRRRRCRNHSALTRP
jgi:hypothetical protein